MRLVAVAVGLVALAATYGSAHGTPQRRAYDTHHYYVAELASPACTGVREQHVAAALGAELVEQVGELQGHWLLRAQKGDGVARRSVHASVPPERDPVLQAWAHLQSRPRGDMQRRCVDGECVAMACISDTVRSVERQTLRTRAKRSVIYDPEHMRDLYPELREAAPATQSWMGREAPVASGAERENRTRRFSDAFHINDPLFYKQWHLVNDEQRGNDLNLSIPWQNATGKGVVVSLIDDGIDYHHPDLAKNFFPNGSYDFNDHTPLPEPRLFDDTHGTRCAGEIAAVKNEYCGVGVAPDAQVAGIRILSGPISDADEAAALNYGYQETSIYSCSWGPSDNGKSMDAPKGLVAKALLNGIYNGRGGNGNLYVFAGGNGGASDDQCNFDGYTNSIFTITIAAVDHRGRRPYYSEMCSAIIASSWSSGAGQMIYTTDVSKGTDRRCTSHHGGTSAAAPLVAGMLALALEIRPDLTWRDAQHLLIASTFVNSPDDPDWQQTQAGLRYSHKFGFGVVDATRLLENARRHRRVGPQAWLTAPRLSVAHAASALAHDGGRNHTFAVTRAMLHDANLARLEHVTATVWIAHENRGSVQVALYSPHGTKSVLASPRRYDSDGAGFPGWTFMSLKHWHEDPVGTWTLEVSDHSAPGMQLSAPGNFSAWSLTLWGEARNASRAVPWNYPTDSEEYSMTLPGAPTATVLHHSGTPMSPLAPPSPTTTRTIAKPTQKLPDDHEADPGEAHEVFGTAVPQPPAADTGYLATLLTAQPTWLIVAAAAGLAAGVALLLYFAVRRRTSSWLRSRYEHVPADEEEFRLGWLGARGDAPAMQARDLYNAFALDE
ncbi:kexin [Malassezia sp. CBS 17886]|nr:kexin [Malassezia sp. CBS 17886]